MILVLVQLNTAARARYDIDDIVTEFPNAKIEVLELPMAYNGATLYKRAFKLRRFLARIKHKQEPFYLVVNVSSSWFTSLDQKLKEVPGMQEIQAPTLGALMPFSSQPKIYFRKTGNFFIY